MSWSALVPWMPRGDWVPRRASWLARLRRSPAHVPQEPRGPLGGGPRPAGPVTEGHRRPSVTELPARLPRRGHGLRRVDSGQGTRVCLPGPPPGSPPPTPSAPRPLSVFMVKVYGILLVCTKSVILGENAHRVSEGHIRSRSVHGVIVVFVFF